MICFLPWLIALCFPCRFPFELASISISPDSRGLSDRVSSIVDDSSSSQHSGQGHGQTKDRRSFLTGGHDYQEKLQPRITNRPTQSTAASRLPPAPLISSYASSSDIPQHLRTLVPLNPVTSRPEDDILFRWRLQCRLEQADAGVSGRKTMPGSLAAPWWATNDGRWHGEIPRQGFQRDEGNGIGPSQGRPGFQPTFPNPHFTSQSRGDDSTALRTLHVGGTQTQTSLNVPVPICLSHTHLSCSLQPCPCPQHHLEHTELCKNRPSEHVSSKDSSAPTKDLSQKGCPTFGESNREHNRERSTTVPVTFAGLSISTSSASTPGLVPATDPPERHFPEPLRCNAGTTSRTSSARNVHASSAPSDRKNSSPSVREGKEMTLDMCFELLTSKVECSVHVKPYTRAL